MAFEMLRQLDDAGGQVDVLILINSPSPALMQLLPWGPSVFWRMVRGQLKDYLPGFSLISVSLFKHLLVQAEESKAQA